MAALDFPTSPSAGQIFTGAGNTWTWNGIGWIAATTAGSFVLKSGDTMSGALTLPGDPISALQAAPKQYIDLSRPRSVFNINSAMLISQDTAIGTSVALAHNLYIPDGFVNGMSGTFAGTIGVNNSLGVNPSGSAHHLYFDITAAQASPGSTHYWVTQVPIETWEGERLWWGTAMARPMVIRLTINSPIACTLTVAVRNAALNRSYLRALTISAGEINTFVTRYITIPGDTGGTWTRGDASLWGYVSLCYMCGAGSSVMSGTSDTWLSGSYIALTSQTNMVSAVRAFHISDFAIYDGYGYATDQGPPFYVPTYEEELRRCLRYYWRDNTPNWIYAEGYTPSAGACVLTQSVQFKPPMRAAPTITLPTTFNVAAVPAPTASGITANGCNIAVLSNGTGRIYFQAGGGPFIANARL